MKLTVRYYIVFLALASLRRLSALGWQTLACAAARICYGWSCKSSPLFKSRSIPTGRLFSVCTIGASFWNSHYHKNEVIPHHYGTHTDDPSQGTVESVLSKTHSNSRENSATAKSGRIGQTRVDCDQFRCSPCADFIHRTAAAILGIFSAISAHRAGDCSRQSLGQQEEEVRRRRLLTIITESSTGTKCGNNTGNGSGGWERGPTNMQKRLGGCGSLDSHWRTE